MALFRKTWSYFLFASAAIFLSGAASKATAQSGWQGSNPCGSDPPDTTGASWAQGQAMIVYDAKQGVCWLANANLAADPDVVAKLGVPGIKPNGTMDYTTAVNWVAALNAANNGAGYLGHKNWQIPVAPLQDDSCGDTGTHGGSFGPGCVGSAMGNLYNVGLHLDFPQSVAPDFDATVEPFHHMKLAYYWALQNNGGTSGTGNGGQEIFSFANGIQGGTTINDTYYYVLPMVEGAIGVPPDCPYGFAGVLPYNEGPAAYQAVYDCHTGFTWPVNANLAGENNFGITGNITIVDTHGSFVVPLIDHGAMLFDTATKWIDAMNKSQYLCSSAWVMPATTQTLQDLFTDLNMASGDARMMWTGHLDRFQDLQPFFYWGCQRDTPGTGQSPCTGYAPMDGTKMLQWSFNFDTGFQSTSSIVQRYFVEVYFPAATPPKP